ncbi:hypothetical protein AKJ47_01915 [candidate division MSBL1 archaeon SCGC-AAA261G05]|uniref:cysteine desulfurase n=2 Tax=candidate division MSBL1 TaxID=215777 RepID=A0A133VB01_9EURY|nr:hypothetical protein AKJ47_01915 [candidate division MSBL1 archaeon SCGC-AAA261G05]KXB04561.1 hypothetical protein AKJ48_02160 [candidate division MSBL1 archaeon SCGC-AAA261O19]
MDENTGSGLVSSEGDGWVYLDHAATTPLAEEAVSAMRPFLEGRHENPSASYGGSAKRAVEDARGKVASLFDTDRENVIFTGCGSESDNMAVKGVFETEDGDHIVTSTIEHPAVRNACSFLERKGADVTWVSPDEDGRINPSDVENAVREDTILISIMHANNETGVIQPLREIGEIADENDVLFHSDTVQSAGKIPTPADEIGLDLASLSAHKFYGPKGVGALYVRDGTELEPLIHGGGQERGLRGGTENVSGIVGMGKAAELALADLEERKNRLSGLRERLIEEVRGRTGARLVGDPENRLPGYALFCFEDMSGPEIVEALAERGIAASSGSACHSGDPEPSRVLKEMGVERKYATGTLRISMGRKTTEEDVDKVVKNLEEITEEVRSSK